MSLDCVEGSVNILRRKKKVNKLIVITGIALVIAVSYGSYVLKRKWNWYWGYEQEVTQIVKPVEKKISDLQKRVEDLEHERMLRNMMEHPEYVESQCMHKIETSID